MPIELPEKITVTINDEKILFIKDQRASLCGRSEKFIYHRADDPQKTPHIVKLPKKRNLEKDTFYKVKITDASGTEIEKPLAPIAELTQQLESDDKAIVENAKKQLQHYQNHKDDLMLMHAFGAVFAPHFITKLMQIAVPENYLHILEDGTPLIFSKFMPGFDEFLSESGKFKNAKTPQDHHEKVALADLEKELRLTSEHIVVLGKLYCVGLLSMHGDIFNDINASNSGCVRINGQLIPACVDWEPVGFVRGGFGGLSADDNAAKNAEFVGGKINFDVYRAAGFQHCVPWDVMVYPLFPRQLTDALEITQGVKHDSLDALRITGFEKAFAEIAATLKKKSFQQLVSETIQEVLDHYMSPKDAEQIRQRVLQQNPSYYAATTDPKRYTLANILQGRFENLEKILIQFQQNKTSKEIAVETFERMRRILQYNWRLFKAPPQRIEHVECIETKGKLVAANLIKPKL